MQGETNPAASNSKDMTIKNFDICFGEKVLITGLYVSLVYGRRHRFVGRNGAERVRC